MKIGVAVPISEFGETGSTPSYAAIREFALRAEATGFDSIWLYDHLLFRRPDKPTLGIWEIWTLLSALAEATERVELGTLVLCVPFRNPALLAKMADTLDEVSGGRVILGLGAGWHQPEFDAFGFPFDHKVDRFEEALKIMAPLLREGTVDFTGTYASAPNCELRPRGPRPSGPPLLVAARGPRMLRLTAQYADAWNGAWYGNPTNFEADVATLHAACAEVGRDPATIELTAGVNVSIPGFDPDPEESPDPTKVLTGSADEIAAGFAAFAALGVGHLMCGNISTTDELDHLAAALDVYRTRAKA